MSRSHVLALALGVGLGFVLGRLSGHGPEPIVAGGKASPVSRTAPHVKPGSEPTPGVRPASRSDVPSATMAERPGTPEEAAADERPAGDPLPPARRALLETIADTSDIDRFLAEVKVTNFFDVLRRSKPFERLAPTLSSLGGRFAGVVRFPDDPAKSWDMVVETALQADDGAVKGEARVSLSENGRVFSQLSGSGDQGENFRQFGEKNGLLIRASPDAYFQLYYVPKLDVFIGNYYRQTAPDRVIPKGTVRLERG